METNYNLYKSFIKVYETKNISRAAELLFISQPALTYNIKQLEQQLGVELFTKHSRGVEPTSQAHLVYKYAIQALNIINNGEDSLEDFLQLKKGAIRIGCHSHISSYLLSDFLIQFKEKYPNIQIEVVSKLKSEMLEMLFLRKLDIIIDFLPYNTSKYNNIEIKKLKQVNNCLVASPALAKSLKYCKNSNKEQIPFLIQSLDSSTGQNFIKNLQSAEINVVVQAWSSEFLLTLAEKGLGVAYCFEEMAKDKIQSGNLIKMPTDLNLPKSDLVCIYIENNLTQASSKFLDLLTLEIKQ